MEVVSGSSSAQSHAAQSAAWPGWSLYGDILGTAPVTSGGPRLNIDATHTILEEGEESELQ